MDGITSKLDGTGKIINGPANEDRKIEFVLSRLKIRDPKDRREMASLLGQMVQEARRSEHEELRDAAAKFDVDVDRIADPKDLSLGALWNLCGLFFEWCGLGNIADRFAWRLSECTVPYDGRRELFNDFRTFFEGKYGLLDRPKQEVSEKDLVKFIQFLDLGLRLFPNQTREWMVEKREELGLLDGIGKDRLEALLEQEEEQDAGETKPSDGKALDKYRPVFDILGQKLAPLKENGIEREYLSYKDMTCSDRKKQFYLELTTLFAKTETPTDVPYVRLAVAPKTSTGAKSSLEINVSEAESLGLILNEKQKKMEKVKVVPFLFNGMSSFTDFVLCAYSILGGTPSRLEQIFDLVAYDIQNNLKDDEVPMLVGFSMGGMFAHACAARLRLPSLCLNPLGCGTGVRKAIGEENWLRATYEDADKHTSFVCQNDWVADKEDSLVRKPILGQGYRMTAFYKKNHNKYSSGTMHCKVDSLIRSEMPDIVDQLDNDPVLPRVIRIDSIIRPGEASS